MRKGRRGSEGALIGRGRGLLRRLRGMRRLGCVSEAHRFDTEADEDTSQRVDALVEVE